MARAVRWHRHDHRHLSNAHLGPDVGGLTRGNQRNMETGARLGEAEVAAARRERDALRTVLAAALRRFPVLALPTLAIPPPAIGQRGAPLTALTAPINLAGLPALAMPVKTPVSLQLVGPAGGEAALIAAGRIVAEAVTAG